MLRAALLVVAMWLVSVSVTAAKKPHIIFMLMDDLGHWDTALSGNTDPLVVSSTANITALAREGVVLNYHYVHWHCSPTRRSFLTGRLPLHHGEELSHDTTDNIDLRWTWISEKLRGAGYEAYWFGKGHTGYKSWGHMPSERGFKDNLFFFEGGGSYYTMPRWNGTAPLLPHVSEYSTDLFGRLSLDAVLRHDPSVPLFLYLPWQAPHSPYDVPPTCTSTSCPVPIRAMLADADRWMGAIVDALKQKKMYKDTLIVFTADNGGTIAGNNFPLRGEKHTSWQGAFLVPTFVSGGLVPESVRGSQNNQTFHVVDWYPTFCKLAGVDSSDDSKVRPLDPSTPPKDMCATLAANTKRHCGEHYAYVEASVPGDCCAVCDADANCTHWVFDPTASSKKSCNLKAGEADCEEHAPGYSSGAKGAPVDIYQGDKAWPSVDGTDIWSHIVGTNMTEPHPSLWLSAQVLLKDGHYKLVVAQVDPRYTHKKELENGWKDQDGVWEEAPDKDWPCNKFLDRTNFKPCLFDIKVDPSERHNLADDMPELVSELWAELNRTQLTAFESRSPESLLGRCDVACVKALWGDEPAPICGVPGCDTLAAIAV